MYLFKVGTLYNVILRIARNLLETRVIIKISTHQETLTDFHGDEAKTLFFEKKKSKWPTQKN